MNRSFLIACAPGNIDMIERIISDEVLKNKLMPVVVNRASDRAFAENHYDVYTVISNILSQEIQHSVLVKLTDEKDSNVTHIFSENLNNLFEFLSEKQKDVLFIELMSDQQYVIPISINNAANWRLLS